MHRENMTSYHIGLWWYWSRLVFKHSIFPQSRLLDTWCNQTGCILWSYKTFLIIYSKPIILISGNPKVLSGIYAVTGWLRKLIKLTNCDFHNDIATKIFRIERLSCIWLWIKCSKGGPNRCTISTILLRPSDNANEFHSIEINYFTTEFKSESRSFESASKSMNLGKLQWWFVFSYNYGEETV